MEDCKQNIRTLDYAAAEPLQVFPFVDVDADQVYGINNDLNKSKKAVSIHAFSQITQAWFNFKFDHKGPDGQGSVPLLNVLGNPLYTYPLFDSNSQIFHYPYAPESASRDEISMNYFRGVNFFIKNDPNLVNDYLHPEWEALRNGIAQILALNIKNDYKALLTVPESPVWTLNEDIPTNDFKINFANPNYSTQPRLHKGQNWNNIFPAKNSGLLNFWYYLLVNGTVSYGPQGYTNEKNHTYFVFQIDNNLAIKLIWNAYKAVSIDSDFQQFRAATFQVLHELGYNEKSKEYIALYDAWAAVMDEPDYASTLSHTPNNGEVIYPWFAKLGVEVEYPLLESSRIFEVSESATFNEQSAPVFRFFNYAAPDLQSGMTHARVNLEPGKTYFWRSHLYKSGSNAVGIGGGCNLTEDPLFCLSLQGKEKWTPTYSFVTATIDGPDEPSPTSGTLAPAWDTPFSWNSILGAHGYLLKIGDDGGVVPMQDIDHPEAYDEDVAKVYHKLALAKSKGYTYTLSARAKLGSEEGVKAVFDPVLGYTTYIPLDGAEKAAFPDTYSSATEPISFNTDNPKMSLVHPQENVKVSPLATFEVKAEAFEDRVDFYRGRIFYQEDLLQPYGYEDKDQPARTVKVKNLPYLTDGHVYGWNISPKKNETLPFITQEETGEVPAPRHFIIDNALIPLPGMVPVDCVAKGADVTLHWFEVPGADGYKYVVTNAINPDVALAGGIVEGNLQTPPLNGISEFPGKYNWSVRAGYKNYKGEWEWGKYSLSSYMVNPPQIAGMSPASGVVSFIPNSNNSITFNWTAVDGVDNYYFYLKNTLTNQTIGQFVGNVNSFKIDELDWDTDYIWSVFAMNPLSPNDIDGCKSGLSASFTTEKEPAKVIPELGFGFFLKDCDDLGLCWPDVTYNLKVTAPNGNIVFNQDGMISNANLAEYPFLQSLGAFDGKLPSPIQNGLYTLTCKITTVGNAAPKIGIWSFNLTAMDLWEPQNNQGPAEQIATVGTLNQIATIPGTILTIKFSYDSSSNTINIQ